MPTSVRRFTAEEWRTYRDLRLGALQDSPVSFGSMYEREVVLSDDEWRDRLASGASSPNQLPLLALVDDAPVGLAWGRISDEEPDEAHIYSVWVAPDCRDRGLGHGLIQSVIDWARGSGVRVVRLDVTVGNDAAVRFYRRFGFMETGEREHMRAVLWSELMVLVLDPA
jgi:ribosomal protein S18 acetylase RimI-like enzyme